MGAHEIPPNKNSSILAQLAVRQDDGHMKKNCNAEIATPCGLAMTRKNGLAMTEKGGARDDRTNSGSR
jgi:hypothetical protein